MNLEEAIVAEATRLGFGAVGFATAQPAQTLKIFSAWVADGRAASMRYLAHHLHLRADPRLLAPGIRSIIVAAARYPTNQQPGYGFSTCARGQDYHRVLRSKLKQLGAFLRHQANAGIIRICVDSAPILEREWAIRAGIGWLGKQGQVISPTLGACFVLGELLVDVTLKPSSVTPNLCGDCHRCVAACPTGAICPDHLLDARRCLSYLTIEHPGPIPDDLAPLIRPTLFGCDYCTAVCPWNETATAPVMAELDERPMPTAAECLKLSQEEFLRRFRATAVLRSGLERLKRNAAAVLKVRDDSRPHAPEV